MRDWMMYEGYVELVVEGFAEFFNRIPGRG